MLDICFEKNTKYKTTNIKKIGECEGTLTDHEKAWDIIYPYIHNALKIEKIPYVRGWMKDNRVVLDYGSHSNFFVIYEREKPIDEIK